MNSFVLKIIAFITMFLDHAGKIVTPYIYPLVYIGRFAFPIFAFQASLGYQHTRSLKKYIIRLFIFAVISQIPYYFYFDGADFNVIFTLLSGIISIYVFELLKNRNLYFLGFLSVAFIAFLAQILNFNYGWYGVFLVFLFYITQNHKILMILGFSIATTILYLDRILITGFLYEPLVLQLIFTLFAIIPILFYNGKEGKKTKYLLYIFYPAHLLLLYLIKILFFA